MYDTDPTGGEGVRSCRELGLQHLWGEVETGPEGEQTRSCIVCPTVRVEGAVFDAWLGDPYGNG